MDYGKFQAIARLQLEEVGAAAALERTFQPHLAEMLVELAELTEQAEALREQVEVMWDDRIRALTREHDYVLRDLFPGGVPSDCYPASETASGLLDAYDAFQKLLIVIHNTAANYPVTTRGRDPRLFPTPPTPKRHWWQKQKAHPETGGPGLHVDGVTEGT